MKCTGKALSLLFIILLVISVGTLVIRPSNAQSIPQPPTPEFIIRYLKASFNITTTNNGATITQQIDNSTIELTIKPYNYVSQYYPTNSVPTFNQYYDVQVKKPSEQKWTDLYPLESKISNYATGSQSLFISSKNNLPASNTSEVKLVFSAKIFPLSTGTYPLGTDFQVRAIIGHGAIAFLPDKSYSPWGQHASDGTFVPAVIYDTSSNWSQTQTVSLPEPSTTPTQIPTYTPTENTASLSPVITYFVIALIIVIVIIVAFFKLQKVFKNA
jgi:hypothetical protein